MSRVSVLSGPILSAIVVVFFAGGCQSENDGANGPEPFFSQEKIVQPGEKWVSSVTPNQGDRMRFQVTSSKGGLHVTVKRLNAEYQKKREWDRHLLSRWSFLTPGEGPQKQEKTINVPSGPVFFVIGRNFNQHSVANKDQSDGYRLECFPVKGTSETITLPEAMFDAEKTVSFEKLWVAQVNFQQKGRIRYRVTSQRMPFEVMVMTEEGYRKLQKVGLSTMVKEGMIPEQLKTSFSDGPQWRKTITVPPTGPVEFTIETTEEAKIRLECFRE